MEDQKHLVNGHFQHTFCKCQSRRRELRRTRYACDSDARAVLFFDVWRAVSTEYFTLKIAVLGAGVLGLTTAHCLALDGHAVEVIERNAGVGLETSFGNGAQLAYSYVAPMAGPGVLSKVLLWLLREDSPLRFKPEFDPQQWRWLMDFVLACNQATSEVSMRHQITLSFYSRTLMHALLEEEKLDFDHEKSGKLVAFSDQAGFDSACRLLDYQRSLGC
jgi:D-amino-acid dehydrogenase